MQSAGEPRCSGKKNTKKHQNNERFGWGSFGLTAFMNFNSVSK
jgi:hypothetical protein